MFTYLKYISIYIYKHTCVYIYKQMYIYIDIYFHIYTYIAYEHSLSPQAQDKGILIGIKMDKVSPAPLSSESVSFRFKNKCFAEV